MTLENPVMSASGTFGSGLEAEVFVDLAQLGALVSKTVTLEPRPGNPPPRIVETPAGMLNSIGLENRGVEYFLAETLPKMKALGPPVIVNIGGESVREFAELARRISAAGVTALELNLSCPNVQEGRLLFATEPALTEAAVREVRQASSLPLFAKLSPNVSRIGDLARAAEQGGADGITAINTLIGMAVDWRRGQATLGRTIGGLSGPAIRPVALRMVYEIRKAVPLPILGVGGIASAEDVLQFLAAGADAVQVGTANFMHPGIMPLILADLERLLVEERTSVEAVCCCMHRRVGGAGRGGAG